MQVNDSCKRWGTMQLTRGWKGSQQLFKSKRLYGPMGSAGPMSSFGLKWEAMKARILGLTIFLGCDGVKVGNGKPGVGGTAARHDANLKLVQEGEDRYPNPGKPCACRTPRINEHGCVSLNPHPGFHGQLSWMPCLDWCRIPVCGETNARVVNV